MISYTETVCIKALAQAKQKSDWGGGGGGGEGAF